MRITPAILSSTTLVLFTSVLAGGCLSAADDPDDDHVDEAQSAEIVAVPLCPDVTKKLVLPPQSCIVHGEAGLRTCTDHITFHYVPVFSLPTGGFPPDIDFTCKLTGTDVTTTCGPCVAIDLPPL